MVWWSNTFRYDIENLPALYTIDYPGFPLYGEDANCTLVKISTGHFIPGQPTRAPTNRPTTEPTNETFCEDGKNEYKYGETIVNITDYIVNNWSLYL